VLGLTRLEIVLIAALSLLVAYMYDTRISASRAIAALQRDGYTDIYLVGSTCRVARAFDKNGAEVDAFACAWRGN
jgi:hypothetical protein